MLFIDGHEDLAYNAVELGRDLTCSVEEIRTREGSVPAHGEGTATVSLPALRAGRVRALLATVFTYPAGSYSSVVPPGYHSPEEAYHRARAQIMYYRRLQQQGEVTLLHSRGDLHAVLHGDATTPGLCLLLEGADPLRDLHDLEQFAAWGVRIIGLAWKGTRYAGGTGMPGPLTAEGSDLLRAMDTLGLALDVSHLAEEAFWQALEIFQGPVVASHANCRALVPGDRQLSDEMIRAIAARDGVIGLIFFNRFIQAAWTREAGKMAVDFADLLPHAAHIIALTGGVRHLALGSDLDGGIGREVVPREIETVADLPRFADTLAAAGYTPDEIAAIMGENWARVLSRVLPEG
jgi:membrane dipeptidase